MSADEHDGHDAVLDDLGRISDIMSEGAAVEPITAIPDGWEVVNPRVMQPWLAGWSVLAGLGWWWEVGTSC